MEEISVGPKPIEGVGTSTAGMLGLTDRGPVDVKLVTNMGEFQRYYGGHLKDSYLPTAVEGFFNNGGARCFIARIISKSAVKSSIDYENMYPRAIGPGTWGNKIGILVLNTNADASADPFSPEDNKKFRIVIAYWKDQLPEKLRLLKANVTPQEIVEIESSLTIDDIKALKVGLSVAEIAAIDAALTIAELKKELTTAQTDEDVKKWKEAINKLLDKADFKEMFDELTLTVSSPNFYSKIINVQSYLITMNKTSTLTDNSKPDTDLALRPINTKKFVFLEDGIDCEAANPPNSIATIDDFKGDPSAKAGEKRGLEAFKEVDEINIVYCPDIHWSGIKDIQPLQNAIKDHCESMKDRFAILDAAQGQREVSKLKVPVDSTYAAFYYPWIKVYDPILKDRKLVPPGGFVAGVYARSDIERGVHKAPANEIVNGALELEFPISKEQQAILNPKGINVIRQFPGRGIRIWGARNTTSDPEWKYVNVRRLFLYVEESIEKGTQWVVFEPNNEQLWARVKQSITNFLTTVWRTGALMGTTPEQAFFVDIGYSTMTPADLDNGKLICMIGIAPTKPAEFVIFRIFQKTLEVK
jgi:phage tail sheath protein FI